MASTQTSQRPVNNAYHHLSSRASSATIFLSRPPHDHIDGATDPFDMIIAQGLLQTESPRIPRRRSSFSHATHPPGCRLPGPGELHLPDGAPCHDQRPRNAREGLSSNTWTSSSGGGSEDDRTDDRTPFVHEYNRLANKYGVQTIVPEEFIAVNVDKVIISAKPGSWIMRKLLKRTSSFQASRYKNERHVRRKRSVSDITLRIKARKDTLNGKDLVELVRLCGTSTLYLPAEYAASTLAVPTCFRATAQYLVQHAAATRGIFRIPGAHSTINALYNHYASQEEDGEVVNGTVRCPTLPEHIECNVHDVASAFKKFLAGLPGGILGKIWLFDAFVSIYGQLDATAELMRTKQSKVRARLIALAVATVAPRYQRELICAVLGLLSMIGRAAETAPREDEHGRPLPTSDLMGYGALGTVFGPLLVGDLLDNHDLRPTGSHGSLVFIQRGTPKSSKGRHKKSKSADDSASLMQGTEKIRIVNSITEMLITHWRDVVRHMKNLGALRFTKQHHSLYSEGSANPSHPFRSDAFAIRRPRDWDAEKPPTRLVDRSKSPTPISRNDYINRPSSRNGQSSIPQSDVLSVRKQRPRPRPMSSQILSGAKSMSILAPTIEENSAVDRRDKQFLEHDSNTIQNAYCLHERDGIMAPQNTQTFHIALSESLEIPNQNGVTVVPERAASCTLNQGPIFTRLQTWHSVSAPDDGEYSIPTLRQSLEEQPSSGQCRADIAIDLPTPFSLEKKAVPSLDEGIQHKESSDQSRAAITPLGSPNGAQAKPEDSPQVPTGIVSSHLRGIAASDPGCELSSGFRRQWKSRQKAPLPLDSILNIASDEFDVVKRYTKDPLTRVSREEDVASLASLAGIIQSQADILYLISPSKEEIIKRPDTPFKITKSRARRTPLVAPVSELDIAESVLEITEREPLGAQLNVTRSTTSPGNTDKPPTTPRRSATESSILGRSGGSSVKALAAKFNKTEKNTRQSPSPNNTPDTRRFRNSPIERAVVSPYTVNSSPIPRSLPLKGSSRSLRAKHNEIAAQNHAVASLNKVRETASSLPANSLFTKVYPQDKFGPPQWPKLRPIDRGPRSDSTLVRTQDGRTDTFSHSSNLRRTGDGNFSFAISRKSSLGTVLPRPEEPPVAGFMDFSRPSATFLDDCSSSFSISGPSQDVFGEAPSFTQRESSRSTSMLYSQIQNLYKQLKAKEDEAEHLRRQLMTRDSLNDLGTLSQQLRQAKRDSSIWRGRAEIAERRLEMLSRISHPERPSVASDGQLSTELVGNGISKGVGEENETQNLTNDLYYRLGESSSEEVPRVSEGSVRRPDFD